MNLLDPESGLRFEEAEARFCQFTGNGSLPNKNHIGNLFIMRK